MLFSILYVFYKYYFLDSQIFVWISRGEFVHFIYCGGVIKSDSLHYTFAPDGEALVFINLKSPCN